MPAFPGMEWVQQATEQIARARTVAMEALDDIGEDLRGRLAALAHRSGTRTGDCVRGADVTPAIRSAYLALDDAAQRLASATEWERTRLAELAYLADAVPVTPPVYARSGTRAEPAVREIPGGSPREVHMFEWDGLSVQDFLWGATITIDTPQLGPGGDDALAAAMCLVAHHAPEALQKMVTAHKAPGTSDIGDPVISMPGHRRFTVTRSLPHLPPEPHAKRGSMPAGIRTMSAAGTPHMVALRSANGYPNWAPAYGVSFLAKGYAASMSDDEPPFYLDPDTTPLAGRVQQAMAVLTGRPAVWESTRLEVDDAALVARLETSEAIVCSRAVTPDEATAHRLVAGEQAYVVTAARQNEIDLHHPIGHRLSLALPAFRELFPDLVVGPALPSLSVAAERPATNMENLAEHLA